VRAGERRPELIDDPAGAPDRSRPPASGEPTAQKPLSSPDLRIADSRGKDIVDSLQDKPTVPPVTEPPVVAPPPPPDPPVGAWGRWTAIAQQDPGVINAQDVMNGRLLVGINRYYVLAANASMTSMALPGAGVGNFVLGAHDGVIADSTNGTAVASTASDGKLAIDFGTRRFDTSMNVTAGSLSTQVVGKGSVDANGRFQSDIIFSPAIISGVVGGKNASEAMYVYEQSFGGRYTAYGATTWHK
jgi:hypothetical protein